MGDRQRERLARALSELAAVTRTRQRQAFERTHTHIKVFDINFSTTGYLSFGPMAQCVVHALKGLALPRACPSRAR
jgi:hypothetical protein